MNNKHKGLSEQEKKDLAMSLFSEIDESLHIVVNKIQKLLEMLDGSKQKNDIAGMYLGRSMYEIMRKFIDLNTNNEHISFIVSTAIKLFWSKYANTIMQSKDKISCEQLKEVALTLSHFIAAPFISDIEDAAKAAETKIILQ